MVTRRQPVDAWTVPPVWGVYTAALSLALVTTDEAERAGAARLVREIGAQELPPCEQRGYRRSERHRTIGDLIRLTLGDRLLDDGDDLAEAA
jgi:hypothetical protein